MIKMIFTLGLLAVLILSIVKKYNVSIFMIFLSIAALAVYSMATGTSMMDEKTTGSLLLDVYELFKSTLSTQMSGTILTMLTIMGYIAFMNYLKATDAFAYVVAGPLRAINKPYLLATLTIAIGTTIKLVLTSPSGLIALFIATMYPILRSCRCSKATIASAFILSTSPIYGMSDPNLFMAYGFAGNSDPDVAGYFTTYGVPLVICALIGMMIAFFFTSQHFDKKSGEDNFDDVGSARSFKEIGVPGIYVLLPALPILFALAFSGLIKSLPTISYVSAIWLSLTVAVLVRMIHLKSFRKGLDEVVEFYKGCGAYIAGPAFIVLGASIFGKLLTTLGGMSMLVEMIMSVLGSNYVVFVGIIAILMFVLCATTGPSAAAALVVPIMASYCAATGKSIDALINMGMMCAGLGFAVYPISTGMVLLSGHTGASISSLMRRNLLPALSGVLVTAIGFLILF